VRARAPEEGSTVVSSRHFRVVSIRWFVRAGVAALLMGLARPAQAAWPTLEEVWRASRERAPGSVRAQSETLLARADGVGARTSSLDNPRLQITADHGVGATPSGASAGLQASGQLALPIDFAGQRSARIRSVDALVAWRESEEAAAAGRAGGAAIDAYGRAVVARARVEQASEAEDQARTEVAWFEARTDAGDATAVDRSLAQVELARHAQFRAEAQIELVEAQADLIALTGLTGAGEPPAEAAPPPWRPSPAAGPARIVEQSPGIEAFDREQAFWGRQVEQARTNRWAPLEIIASGGQDEFGQVRIGGGLGWSLPLFRRNEGEIARAVTEASRTRADRDAVVRAAEATVRGLDEQLARTGEAVVALDRAGIPAAEGLVRSTDAAFRAGKLELVRVLNARRDLAVMRERRLDLLEGGWRAYGTLAAILGVLP
jgi:cobalt-zinc-cadmium efflux system outer membrane protein